MFFRSKAVSAQARAPLPPRLASLLRESWWLALVALALYLRWCSPPTIKPIPAGRTADARPLRNAGGRVGAWVADMLLYLFGLSAYWWVVFLLFATWWGYRRIEGAGGTDRRTFWIAFSGFLALLLSSSSLEALRLHSLKAVLPLAPGGMLGVVASAPLNRFFGFTGATLLLLFVAGIGFSLFSGLSWLEVSERLGGWIESAWAARLRVGRRRATGVSVRQAAQRREVVVEEEKKKLEEHVPIHIEPPQLAIAKSERVKREQQKPLFEDLPDSPLPPLHLLDEPAANVEVLSADTLEFTSRLIEKKLLDFGVEVKVVAAYPGPVITRYEIEPAVGVKGSQITNLVKDLARALSVVSIRVVETIPGKSCMGLEIPNPKRQMVRLSEILSSQVYADMGSPLTIAMGKDIAGKPVVADLAQMPHVLVAGTTGSGKSVAINAMILSLLYKATPTSAPDPDRSEDAGAVDVRRHPASARAGGHRHEAGRQRAELVRGGNGPALPADVGARRAQHRRLQPEGARMPRRRASRSPIRSRSRRKRPSR